MTSPDDQHRDCGSVFWPRRYGLVRRVMVCALRLLTYPGRFRYHDGIRWRTVSLDPAFARLDEHAPNGLKAVLAVAAEVASDWRPNTPPPSALPVARTLATLAANAFDLSPPDDTGRGLTVGDRIGVLARFWDHGVTFLGWAGDYRGASRLAVAADVMSRFAAAEYPADLCPADAR